MNMNAGTLLLEAAAVNNSSQQQQQQMPIINITDENNQNVPTESTTAAQQKQQIISILTGTIVGLFYHNIKFLHKINPIFSKLLIPPEQIHSANHCPNKGRPPFAVSPPPIHLRLLPHPSPFHLQSNSSTFL
jgi:hypothetical protein